MDEITRWWWVRHGPTHQKTFTGWRDVPADLSDTAAIERLSAHLPASAVMVSSDLSRAVETLASLNLSGEVLPPFKKLREIDFGIWDGMAWKDIEAQYPEESRAFWENPGDLAAPRGESWNQMSARVNQTVDYLTKRYSGRDIVCVAHLGVIVTQVQRALGISAYEALSYSIDPLSVTEISISTAGWDAGRINHIC